MKSQPNPQKKIIPSKWQCPKCSFDNEELIPSCEMCEEPREKHLIKLPSVQFKPIIEPGIICSNSKCKYLNPLTQDTCQKCSQILFPSSDDQIKKQVLPVQPKVDLIFCKKCSFANDPSNQYCVNCDKKLLPRAIRKKSVKFPRAPKGYMGHTSSCPTCGQPLRVLDFSTGETDLCMECEEQNPAPLHKSLCLFCDTKITVSDEDHDERCQARLKFYAKEDNSTFDTCTDLQYLTMVYMHRKCQKLHYRKEKQLIDRIRKLGYTEKDLENLHHYIIHYAPIIIHMHVNTHFHFFLKDTHYRNQFETSKSSGSLSHSARTQWEDRMFDRKHHDATGFERVKYGTMNFTNDPKGVRACVGYGQSYFLLKPHVRDRCTITDMDSSSPAATLGTFRFIFHLLLKLSDAELHSAFEGSKGKEMKSHVIGAYKEIQIHGPVEFAKDIERVYISKNELKLGDAQTLLEQVKSFCSQHSLEYELFDSQERSMLLGGVIASDPSEPTRIIGDDKELTVEDLKPKLPPPSVFGGFGLAAPHPFASSAFGTSIFGGGFGSSSLFPSFHFGPALAPPPKKVEKKSTYGVDYI